MVPGVPAAGHLSSGGFWHPGREEGCVKCEPTEPRVRVIRSSDIARCPKRSLSPSHYRDDGTCLCGGITEVHHPPH